MDEDLWNVYESIFRNSCVNARTLLGEKQFITPWLSSGYPHTADINCLKMGKIVGVIKAIINHSRGAPMDARTSEFVGMAYSRAGASGDLKEILEGGDFV